MNTKIFLVPAMECMCAQTRSRFIPLIRKSFGGMESGPMFTPKEKSPLPEKFSSEEDRTHDAAASGTASPTHYQLSYSGPRSGCFLASLLTRCTGHCLSRGVSSPSPELLMELIFRGFFLGPFPEFPDVDGPKPADLKDSSEAGVDKCLNLHFCICGFPVFQLLRAGQVCGSTSNPISADPRPTYTSPVAGT